MPWRRLLGTALAAAILPWLAGAAEPVPAVPGDSLQLLVIVSRGWEATAATLLRFERAAPGAPWLPVGLAKRGVVGRSGMAWGRGLHPEGLDGAEKYEGDGATPAGVFRITSAFGAKARKVDLAWTVARPGLVCVTDKTSPHYNTVVDLARIPMRWDTDEPLLGVDDSYEVALVLDQNPAPAVPGRGSCTFVHAWKGTGTPTSGGVATTRDAVDTLVEWLDASVKPVAVVLPWVEYRRYQRAWTLPALQEP